ncbi:MAG: ComF family protein [Burkholderiaceae bacterium]|jgi:ComF family protein|nr:ComF family protein [Burkholderiaceae bacterium]
MFNTPKPFFRNAVRTTAQAFTRWQERWPSQCLLCHAWPARPVCDACAARLAAPRPRCRRCALPVPEEVAVCGACLRDPPPLDACVACCDYQWPWPKCIAAFKFGADPGWARSLALLMRAAPRAEQLLDAADRVLPVPLARARLRERGFNQALELARCLAPTRMDARLLLRVRETPPQSGLKRAQRLRNLHGAFALDPARAAQVLGRRVLLVDDVMTSGASLHAAARALRAGGAARVDALVFARTAA